MKNTPILASLGIVFDPYRYFPDFIKADPDKIVEQYRHLSMFQLKDLLEKTKYSSSKLSLDQEYERDQITFALFKRIEVSDPDATPVDSVLLAANDPVTLQQLAFNEQNNPANIATLGFIRSKIPSRHMRGFYQITLEAGFVFENLQHLFHTVTGYDRELALLLELESRAKSVA